MSKELNIRLNKACIDGNLSLVQSLIECGANINYYHEVEPANYNIKQYTPLTLAISNNHFHIANYFLDHVNTDIDKHHPQALSTAISKFSIPMVEKLIEHGATLDLSEHLCHSVVASLLESEQIEIIKYFILHHNYLFSQFLEHAEDNPFYTVNPELNRWYREYKIKKDGKEHLEKILIPHTDSSNKKTKI